VLWPNECPDQVGWHNGISVLSAWMQRKGTPLPLQPIPNNKTKNNINTKTNANINTKTNNQSRGRLHREIDRSSATGTAVDRLHES